MFFVSSLRSFLACWKRRKKIGFIANLSLAKPKKHLHIHFKTNLECFIHAEIWTFKLNLPGNQSSPGRASLSKLELFAIVPVSNISISLFDA